MNNSKFNYNYQNFDNNNNNDYYQKKIILYKIFMKYNLILFIFNF